MTQTVTKEPEVLQPLVVADETKIKQELALIPPADIAVVKGEYPELEAKAEQIAVVLTDFKMGDMKTREESVTAVENLGAQVVKRAVSESAMLKEPVRKLSRGGEDGGTVAKSLVDLKVQVEALDPGDFDFEAGFITRTIGRLPFVGTPMKRYFTQYESAQTVIAAIIRSLQDGGEQLKRDNITLRADQTKMRETTLRLEKTIKLGQLIDTKIEAKLDDQVEEQKVKFIQEELLFPLRQRIIDLQQSLAVNQQGVLAVEIIIRNNKELIRGVNRALDVTVTALEVAVMVAIALAHQKIVLDKIEALNVTTSKLIAGTASRLKTQGVAIHKQASSAQLDMASLKAAFADIHAAMEDVSNFRVNALPQMAQAIIEMDTLTASAEKVIQRMEEGNAVRPQLAIEVE